MDVEPDVLLADEGIYFFQSQGDLVENLSELSYEYQIVWQGPGFYQIDFDARMVVPYEGD